MSTCFEQFPNCLEARLEELRQARAHILQEVELAPIDDEATGTNADKWSIAEIVFHLHLVEKRIRMGLKRVLESSARGALADETNLRTEWERLRSFVGARAIRVKAPPWVAPRNAPKRADAVALV